MNGGDFGLGVLMGAAGLGLLVGQPARRRLGRAAPDGGGLFDRDRGDGAGRGLTAISPTVWVAAAFIAVCGVGTALRRSATRCSCSAARRTSCAGASSR